jgi:hypothetical protein
MPGVKGAAMRHAVVALVGAVLVAAASAQPKPAATALTGAERAVLDRFAGTWDVTVTSKVPKLAPVTSRSTWMWILDHRYLRGESGIKSDGSQEMQVFGHDPGGYSLWIFSSSGLAINLPRGEWNESTGTMAWKNAPADPIVYASVCTFEGAGTLRCSTQVKKSGKVVIDVESVAARKRP